MTVQMRKVPSAVLPVIMSAVALGIVLLHVAMFGIVHETDEGTPAHIFQLLMAVQAPIAAYFAITWLPRAPRQAAQVLALQLGAAMAAFAAVYFLTD